MKNIYYPVSLFHKAIKRNKPKKVYFHSLDFWFHTQKACLICNDLNSYQQTAMRVFLKQQNIEVQNEPER